MWLEWEGGVRQDRQCQEGLCDLCEELGFIIVLVLSREVSQADLHGKQPLWQLQ